MSLTEADGYESVSIGAWIDPGLTTKVLHHALETKSKQDHLRDQVERPSNEFVKKLGFVLERHNESVRELIWVRAYSLKAVGKSDTY